MPQTLGHNDLKKYVFRSLQLESRKEQNHLKWARSSHSENHYYIWSSGWGKYPQLTVCLWFRLNVTGLVAWKAARRAWTKNFWFFYVAINCDLKDHNCSSPSTVVWNFKGWSFCLGFFFSKEKGLVRKRNWYGSPRTGKGLLSVLKYFLMTIRSKWAWLCTQESTELEINLWIP